jgi:hypothetical protein
VLGVQLLVADAEVDEEELDQLAGSLREALLELDVDEVAQATAGEAPEGAKGLELLTIGGLVVRFVLRPDVLRSVVGTIRGWLAPEPVRTVELVLDGDVCKVTGTTSEEQDRLIDLWIARHAGTA